jgi:outer membrane protein
MRHKWILLLLPAFLGMAYGQQPDHGTLVLSLKRAVLLAISPEGNAEIRVSGEALKQAQSHSAQTRSELLPGFESSLNYRSQTLNLRANGLQLDIPTVSGFSFTFPSLVGPFNVMDARITASQSIFNFSSIRRYQASKAGVSVATSDMDSAKERVAAQVARAYLSAVRADAEVETAQANVILSQAVLAQAENQKRAGTGTGIEITRAQVQLANDRQRLLVAENSRCHSHLQLLRLLDLPLDTELELIDRLGYVPVDTITLKQARELAIATRPDLRAQQKREASARLSKSAAKMERLPTLSFFGDYGSIGSGMNNARPTRVYGLTLRIPIFDGGRVDARRAEAASQYRSEQIRTNDLKQEIELEIRLALDALDSAEEQTKVAREGLELSEKELTQARRRYDAGITSSLEVTDAQTRLARARDNQIQALYNYNLARIDLEQAMGMASTNLQ